jgi:hypothetical protein
MFVVGPLFIIAALLALILVVPTRALWVLFFIPIIIGHLVSHTSFNTGWVFLAVASLVFAPDRADRAGRAQPGHSFPALQCRNVNSGPGIRSAAAGRLLRRSIRRGAGRGDGRIGMQEPATGQFRFRVTDIFAIHGRGTVVAGLIEQGTVRAGDRLRLIRGDASVGPVIRCRSVQYVDKRGWQPA